jgi:hypothetical protein
MCQKSSKVFKQFYAVVSSSSAFPPRSLQVFKNRPTEDQIKLVIRKVEPFIYSEKPKIDIIPIHIPVDILYN